eukprot:450250_1
MDNISKNKSKNTKRSMNHIAPVNNDTHCKHIGCSCTTFKVPTSKWTKNKSLCKSCNHSKNLHGSLTVHATHNPKDDFIDDDNFIIGTKIIPSTIPSKLFTKKEIDKIDKESKYVVYGYARHSNCNGIIPEIILFIVLSYYYTFENEEFDTNLCGPNITISKNKKRIDKHKKGGAGLYETVFGNNVISSMNKQTYVWIFRNIGGEIEDSRIGICNANMVNVKGNFTAKYRKTEFYGYNAFWGSVEAWNENIKWKFPRAMKKGDIIEMKLEITDDDGVLSYRISNNPERVAFNITKRDDLSYRMAVSLSYGESCIELVEFRLGY